MHFLLFLLSLLPHLLEWKERKERKEGKEATEGTEGKEGKEEREAIKKGKEGPDYSNKRAYSYSEFSAIEKAPLFVTTSFFMVFANFFGGLFPYLSFCSCFLC